MLVVAVAAVGLACERGERTGGVVTEDPKEIVTRMWKVPADFLDLFGMSSRGDESVEDPFGGDLPGGVSCSFYRPAIDVLKESGIDFPPGASAEFSPVRGELMVRHTRSSLDRLGAMIEELVPLMLWVVDERLFREMELTAEERMKRGG